jgi:hypothetical protein
MSLKRLQNEPDHHCAAFDIVCAGAEGEVALDRPAEIISRFFLRWEYRIEMRDERDTLRTAPATSENKMLAEERVRGGNHFRNEAEGVKTFSRESPEMVHTLEIQREAVNANHLPEQFERGRELRFEEGFQM